MKTKWYYLVFICLLLDIGVAKAYTCYYVSLSGTPTANGLSPLSPCSDLQKMLTLLVAGDTLKIATGTYESPSTGSSFEIYRKFGTAAIRTSVIGGWNSTFTIRNPVLYPTTLKSSSVNKYAVLYIPASFVILDGLTIQDGNNINSPAGGGGIQIDNFDGGFSTTIRNCIFRNNKATKNGGAVLTSNQNSGWYSALTVFYNCTFDGNTSTAGWGGAVAAFGPQCNYYNCTFFNNFAYQAGGAVHHQSNGCDFFFSCTIVGNKAQISPNAGLECIESFIFNSIVAGNKSINNPTTSNDVAYRATDYGYNIFGQNGFKSDRSGTTIHATSLFATTKDLYDLLDTIKGNYAADERLFPARLALNGGFTPNIKLKKTTVKRIDGVTVSIDNHPYTIPTPTAYRTPIATDTISIYDQRYIKRATGNVCVGAYEYTETELTPPTFTAVWSPDRGAVTMDIDFYKYKKDVRFNHEMYTSNLGVVYSLDGITYNSVSDVLFFISSNKQIDKRGQLIRSYTFQGRSSNNRFEIRNRVSITDGWKTINSTTITSSSDYSTSGTFTTRVHWQIPTALLGRKIYLKLVSYSPVTYDQDIVSTTGTTGITTGYSKTFSSIFQVLDVTSTPPAITTAAAWQTNGSLNYTITTPSTVPTTASYTIKMNTLAVKTSTFSTKVQNFVYSNADISQVKKYTLTTTYSPNSAFAGFPTYTLTSNETIVKAYSLPVALTVTASGCDQKNTVSFTVPAVTDVANCETANFELCRAEDSTFTTDYTSLGAIAYVASKTDYSFTDPELLGVNQNKKFYYKLRRVPLVAAWDWSANVRTGSTPYITTHLQIGNIDASIINGKPQIDWSYTNTGIFCTGSQILIQRSIGNLAPVTVATITDINTKQFIDNTTLDACTPLTYSIQIGSSTHGFTTATASNKVLVPLAAADQPALNYMKASKGYYNDRVELEWYLRQGTLSTFLVKRKLYDETSDKYATIAEINATASKLYKYTDIQTVPAIYYTYQIVSVTSCNGISTETTLLSDIGFRMPTSSVSGRVVYTGDVPVEGVNLIIQSADQMRNRALTLGSGTMQIPNKTALLNTTNFSIQAYLRFKEITATYTLIDKGTQFQLIKSAAKLQIKIGTITKDITGYALKANIYFHLSIVKTSTTSFIVYIDGAAVATLSGYSAAVANTTAVTISATVSGLAESANIDELRIWSKALTATDVAGNYDRYISGKETDLYAYYRLDERIKDFAFDMSSNGTVYNENHAIITGTCARTEADIPSSLQLSLKGKTDVNGNYLVGGIPYYSDGSSYTFTPQLGTHVFNPTQRPLFLGDKSSVQNNVDFTDVSTFTYEGVVVYSGGTYPVEGANFLLDGQPIINSSGAYVVTDADGKYSLTIPIGVHTIEAVKYGHTFSSGKCTVNLSQNIVYPTGFRFEDNTRIKLIGRVVGGKAESEKALLVGQSVNNIGTATIVLQPLRYAQYVLTSTAIDTAIIYHDDGSLTRPTTASNKVKIEGTKITIKTSPLTGEFVAYVYPLDYTITQTRTASTDILNGVTGGLYLKNKINPMYEVSKWTDTILVAANGNQLAYKKTVEKVDSVLYYEKYIQTLIVDPDFSIKELDATNAVKYYNGESVFEYTNRTTNITTNINLVTLTNNIPTYIFGKPVYQQGGEYSFLIEAFERYTNADNRSIDLVPVSECSMLIDNTMKLDNPNTPETFALDSLGKGVYTFVAGVPDLTTGLKKFEAYLSRDNRLFTWTGKFTSYLLGGRSSGTNFTTAGPDKVLFILRDPPGSSSNSYLEKGSAVNTTSSFDRKQMLEYSSSATLKLGVEVTTFAGLGFGVISDVESTADLTFGLHIQQNYSYKTESALSVTTTKRYETSSDPLWVGSDADLFVGVASNILYGAMDNITVIKYADIKPTNTLILRAGTNAIVKCKGLAIGESFSTEFAYTQRDLEQIFIPAWQQIRNNLLLPLGTVPNRATITRPVYVSLLAPDDERFGSNNNDKTIWGASAKDLVGDGPSYKIVLPANQTTINIDSVSWCNNQVNLWQIQLAENEKQKLNAVLIKNQSFTSGAKFEYSEATDSTTTTTAEWDVMLSGQINVETGFEVMGLGVLFKQEFEAGGGYAGSSERAVNNTKTIGFVMEESGDFDVLSVDYKRTSDGGISFITRAGQTCCPYEGASYTKYYQPGTILNEATLRIEKPAISVVKSVVSNVPANHTAVFELELKNESEANGDAWYRLLLDGTTNPSGAILRIDGAEIDEVGRTYLVKAGQTLIKTLTLEKGPNSLEFNNIRLILASTCQYDPTDFTEDIFDDVTISATFIPNCTDVNLTSPQNNWIMNTVTGDTLAVKLENYDINYANFGYIALQSKASSSSTWNEEMKFYSKTALYNTATGAKTLLDLTKNKIEYKMRFPYVDNSYDVRAVAYCLDASKVIISQTPTSISSGLKDMVRPQVFGTPQPADGILNSGDEIMVQFNEAIAEGNITQNNFSVTGIKNGTATMHTASVHFDGTSSKMTTEQTINLAAKSFTFECWLKRNAIGRKGVILSHGSSTGFEFGFTIDNKLYVKNGTATAIVGTIAYTDISNWHHYALVYDVTTNKISTYVDGNFDISDQVFGAYNENGILRVGTDVAATAFTAADIHELRAWDVALMQTDIQANKTTTYTGIEKGMIGYWKMNEAKGTAAVDQSRGRNGVLAATWAFAPAGKSVSLTGIGSSLALNTTSLPIVPASDYSIELWFKGATQTNACLYSAGRGDGLEWGSSINNAAIWFDANSRLNFANNGKTVVLSSQNYLDNQWHHVAVCVNRLGTANMYVDGILVNNVDARGFTAVTAATTYIGMRKYMSATAFNTYVTDMPFRGLIDEVRIWNKNLTETSVLNNMNKRLAGNETGLAAYYPFDKYSGANLVYTLSEQTVKPLVTDPILVAVATNATESAEYAPVKIDAIAENLGFTYATNDDKIIITITEAKNVIEKTLVNISVFGIQDKNENVMASPISWNAYIDKNQLKWEEQELKLNKVVNAPYQFKMNVVNSGGLVQKFEIINLPSWLTASATSGTLKALTSTEITFTMDNALNIGSYNEMIYLRGGEFDDALMLNVNVLAEIPNWTVDAAQYISSMNIIASLTISGVVSTDQNDKVAVFIDGECRGVAQPVYYKEYDKYFVYLKVYGNENSQNKELTFRAFDAGSGKIFSVKPVTPIVFIDNDLKGLPSAPIILSTNAEVFQITALNSGWTWISFGVASNSLQTVHAALAGMKATSACVVKNNATGTFDSYSENARAWNGSLTMAGGFDNTSMYLLKTDLAQSFILAGTAIDPTMISLNIKGSRWNYISYLTAGNKSVREAMAGYVASPNDLLKSQTSFAVYDALLGWTGDLKYMKPGEGYMLYRTAATNIDFTYPRASNKKTSFDEPVVYPNLKTGVYSENMSIIATVKSDFKLNSEDWILGYCDNELRSATRIGDIASNALFVSVAGESEAKIRFALERNGQIIAHAIETANYQSDKLIGSISNPFVLSFNGIGIEKVTVSTYPNPVTDKLHVQVNTFSDKNIDISIVNILGTQVFKTVSGNAVNNSYETTVNTNSLKSGLYFIQVRIEGKVFVNKFIKN